MNRLNDQIPPFEAVNDVPAACFLNALARESELIQFEHNSSVPCTTFPCPVNEVFQLSSVTFLHLEVTNTSFQPC